MPEARVTNEREFREAVTTKDSEGLVVIATEPFTVTGQPIVTERPRGMSVVGMGNLRVHCNWKVNNPNLFWLYDSEVLSMKNQKKALVFTGHQIERLNLHNNIFGGIVDEAVTIWPDKGSFAVDVTVRGNVFLLDPWSSKNDNPHAYPLLMRDTSGGVEIVENIFAHSDARNPALNRCGAPENPAWVANNVALWCRRTGAIITAESEEEREVPLPPGRDMGCWVEYAGNIWEGDFPNLHEGAPIWVKERRDGKGDVGVKFWTFNNRTGATNRTDLMTVTPLPGHLPFGQELADIIASAGPGYGMESTLINGSISLAEAREQASALVMKYAEDEPPVEPPGEDCCKELELELEKTIRHTADGFQSQFSINERILRRLDALESRNRSLRERLTGRGR